MKRFFGTLNRRLAEVREAETFDYPRFFDDLTPQLEKARMRERELDIQLARRFNVLDYLRTDELGLSRIIADLLDPRGKHGQGELFLKLLLERLPCFTAPSDLDQVQVKVEETIADDRRIDICVRMGNDCCLAIENKPYAGDQEHQIEDYLDWLSKYGKSLLIYLSPQGEPPSSNSIALECLGDLKAGQFFKIMPYCKAQGPAWEDGFEGYRTDRSLAEWLADCRMRCDVDRLRWFLHEAETFCTRTFGGNTVASNEISTIKEFVLSEQQTWDTALAISHSLSEIKKQVCSDFLEMIRYKLHSDCRDPDGLTHNWNYDEKKQGCCVEIFKESWNCYSDWPDDGHSFHGKRTHIRLEGDGIGPNNWIIGVCSCSPKQKKLKDEEKERGRRLKSKLSKELPNYASSNAWWPCKKRIEKYRNWDSLVFRLHEECGSGGGEIMDYFIEELNEIAKVAIPIIDKIEGIQ